MTSSGNTVLTDILQLQMHALSLGIEELSWVREYSTGTGGRIHFIRLVRGLRELISDHYGMELARRVGNELNPGSVREVIYYPRLHKLVVAGAGKYAAETYDLAEEADLKRLGWV